MKFPEASSIPWDILQQSRSGEDVNWRISNAHTHHQCVNVFSLILFVKLWQKKKRSWKQPIGRSARVLNENCSLQWSIWQFGIHLQYVYSMNRFLQGKALLAVYYEGSSQTGCPKSCILYIPVVYLGPSLSLSLPSYLRAQTCLKYAIFQNQAITTIIIHNTTTLLLLLLLQCSLQCCF